MTVTYEMLARTQEPQRVRHENNLRLNSIGGLIISATITIAACIPQGQAWHWFRTAGLLLAVPPLALSKRAADELTTEARDREDRGDIYTQARQDSLYKMLTQTAPPPDAPTVVEEPPVIGTRDNPRTDWQPLFSELFSARNSDGSFLYPCVFLVGPQGTGKTTFLKYIQQLLIGQTVVIDSHYKAGNWKGADRVVGKAQNYEEIEGYLSGVTADVKARYKLYSTIENQTFEPVTIIAEEMTNWSDHVDPEVATPFIKGSLSDFRKVNYRLVSVAHAETNTARGGAKGTAKMRSQGEVRIELIQKGLALVTMPGTDDFYLQFPNLELYTGGSPSPPGPPTPPMDKAPIPQGSNVVAFTQAPTTPATPNPSFTAQDAIALIADHLAKKSPTDPMTIGRIRSQVRALKSIPDHGWAMVIDALSGAAGGDGYGLIVTSHGETIKVALSASEAA